MPLSPSTVHQHLAATARRYRWVRWFRQVLSGMAFSLGILAILLLADAYLHFGTPIRWVSFLLVTLPFLASLAWSMRKAMPKISESSIARRIETATKDNRNTLISAVQFDRELPADSRFRTALFSEMQDPFPRVDWSKVFDLELLKRVGISLGTVVAFLALYAGFRPLYFANSAARILMPASKIAPLTRTRIASITPGDTRVLHGADLRVNVDLEGEIPKGVWCFTREPDGQWQRTLMEHEIGSGHFTLERKEIRQPVTYRIEAGDAASPVYQVSVRPPTAIVARRAELEPPAYTHLPKATVANFTGLQGVIPGTRVTLSLQFNNPVTDLQANSGMPPRKEAPTRWTLTGLVKESSSLRLEFRDSDGITETDTIPIATSPDEAPQIVITTPTEGKELFSTRTDFLTITFNARDNFGLDSVTLFRTNEEAQDAERIQGWQDASGKKSFGGSIKIPLAKYARNDRVTLAIQAKDQNNVSGPGITWSRPIVVTLRSQDQIAEKEENASKKAAADLDSLIKLQATNLEETQRALGALKDTGTANDPKPVLVRLLDRQSQVAEVARKVAQSAEEIAPETRSNLQSLLSKEMPEAILTLRNTLTGNRPSQILGLTKATQLEAAILARLKAASQAEGAEISKAKIQEMLSGVEELLRSERDLLKDSQHATPLDAKPLSERQDGLAEKSITVRKSLEKSAQDGALGDQEFRDRVGKAAGMFKELAVYEQMLAASEKLQGGAFPAALEIQKQIVTNLAKIAELLNQWQLAAAQRDADAMKQAAKEMANNLEKLAEIQREVVEKSKEIARKAEMHPEDIAAAEEMKKNKDLMAEVVEQMLTDAHIFPDMKPSNELRGELTQIYEDVIQADTSDAAAGKLEAKEIAVQKEDSLLQAIEQAKKVAEDLEMWLPTKNDTVKWLSENFDKTEMPDIPNLPLPDAFEDLVGDLLKEQEGLADQAMDAASNQVLAQAQQGWEVADGPMPGFSAQGKSGNTRPNKNEQTGRSSGGREGMSNGEMVGDTASNLEGTTPEVRRTNDPLQQGHIKDDGGIQRALATGGGKAGGYSDRNGMDGNAPVRPSNAPHMTVQEALAVQQALLAEKTSKTYAQANLLFLRAKGLTEVARLMDQSQAALKEARMDDFRNLHQRILGRLNEVKGSIVPGNVLSISSAKTSQSQEKQLLGGDEGQAPPAYQKAVSDYYRALQE